MSMTQNRMTCRTDTVERKVFMLSKVTPTHWQPKYWKP